MMTAYDFTRFDADFTAKVKASAYDAGTLELQIVRAHKDDSPRNKEHYKECEQMFIECTMSCDREEAINWMEYWMGNAIAYGIATKCKDWQYKFLAAYDIFNSLCRNKRNEKRMGKQLEKGQVD